MDWILEARCFVDGQLTDCCVGVDEQSGRIEAVRKVLTGAPIRRLRGHVVLPSAVDTHVHFRDPGAGQSEDFRSGTQGALLGGVGTVFDMPNTTPVVDSVDRLEEKADEVKAKALVDYGLWATVTRRTDDASALAAAADGIKLYMAPTTGMDYGADDATIARAVAAARTARRIVAVHAEAEAAPEPATLAQHDAARPLSSEAEAVSRLARSAGPKDRIHVCHASGVSTVDAARNHGFSVACTPHHLRMSVHARWSMSGRVNPPLRAEEVRRALWVRFRSDPAVLLETDHAPHRWQDKDAPFSETPAGLPGVQTTYPVMMALVKEGRIQLERLVSAYADGPARLLGLERGRIAPGFRADMVAFDVRSRARIARDWLVSPDGWSPFEGAPAFIPTHHILGGQWALENGSVDRRPGSGRRVAGAPR